MRVLVCGGRNYGYVPSGVTKWTPAYYQALRVADQERATLEVELSRLARPTLIIHGEAHGADELAAQWARRNDVADLGFRANWYPHGAGRNRGPLDRSAVPRRNQRMIDEGKPDFIIAFPGGSGTADMVRRARAANVEVIEIAQPHLRL